MNQRKITQKMKGEENRQKEKTHNFIQTQNGQTFSTLNSWSSPYTTHACNKEGGFILTQTSSLALSQTMSYFIMDAKIHPRFKSTIRYSCCAKRTKAED